VKHKKERYNEPWHGRVSPMPGMIGGFIK